MIIDNCFNYKIDKLHYITALYSQENKITEMESS